MIESVLGWLWKLLSLLRSVRVTAHVGRLIAPEINCCFVTVTNRSPFRKAVITEVWFDVGRRIPVINNERPLPKVLPIEEVWETWMPLNALPEHVRAHPETSARVKLSDGTVLIASVNTNVAPAGHVPG
jgi:hypothetical protein